MSNVDELVAQMIGAALEGNDPDSMNLAEQLVSREGAAAVLRSIRQLCVAPEQRFSAEVLVSKEMPKGHRQRFNSALLEGALFSDPPEQFDRVVAEAGLQFTATALVLAALEKCLDWSAILTWSCADLVASDAPNFFTMRQLILNGAASTNELLRLADHLDAHGEELAARAVASAAKALRATDSEPSRTPA